MFVVGTGAVLADTPAGPDQAVIAQGVAEIADGSFGWSIDSVDLDADELSDLTAGGIGFVVAEDGTVLMESKAGQRSLLDRGDGAPVEAAFRDGADGSSVSAISDEATYLRIDLVTGDDVIGDSFDLDAGAREITMIQGDLDAGQAASLVASEQPVLLIATDGDLSVEQQGGPSGALAEDNAVLLNPGEEATLSAEDGAAYIAVYIGDPIDGMQPSATATQAAQPTQAPVEPTQAPPAPTTPPAKDSDNDGLSDEDEAIRATDPLNPDTDSDGLYDGYEVYESGTVPTLFDSDGDGLPDGDELNSFGTNPSNPDSDGDGLNDYREAIDYLTNPNAADSDGDGLDDYSELMTYFTNPMDPNTDGDIEDDGFEVNNGTDPLDPNSNSAP
jgi:hypothetical protein